MQSRSGSYSLKLNPESTVVADQIIDAIRNARKSIYIATAHFNYVDIAEALVEKSLLRDWKGDIKVLIDQSDGSNISQRDHLSKNLPEGSVRTKYYQFKVFHPKAKLMHHKFMIVDGKILFTGSYNWSETAEQSNLENMVVFEGKKYQDLIQKYSDQFDKVWNYNRDQLDALYDSWEKENVIALHWKVGYSLTQKEWNDLRATAKKLIGKKFLSSFAAEHLYYDKKTGRAWGAEAH